MSRPQPPPTSAWKPASSLAGTRATSSIGRVWTEFGFHLACFLLCFLPAYGLHEVARREAHALETHPTSVPGERTDTGHALPLLFLSPPLLVFLLFWGARIFHLHSDDPSRSVHFGPRPPWLPRRRRLASDEPAREAHEATLARLNAEGTAAALEAPWSQRPGLLWTCEIDLLISTRSESNWSRLYASGGCAPLALRSAHHAGSLWLDACRDSHPPTSAGHAMSSAIGLTLGLPIHEDAERHPSAWAVESSTGLAGLPDPVRQTLEAHPNLLGALRMASVKRIRAYETVLTELAPVTVVGAWTATSSTAADTYRALPDTEAAPAVEPSSDAYLFLGSREAWARWLDKEPRVARALAVQLVVFVALLVAGVVLLW